MGVKRFRIEAQPDPTEVCPRDGALINSN